MLSSRISKSSRTLFFSFPTRTAFHSPCVSFVPPPIVSRVFRCTISFANLSVSRARAVFVSSRIISRWPIVRRLKLVLTLFSDTPIVFSSLRMCSFPFRACLRFSCAFVSSLRTRLRSFCVAFRALFVSAERPPRVFVLSRLERALHSILLR